MSKQYWIETLVWVTSDGTAVANTTDEAIAIPNVTVPANYMQDGRLLRMMAFGRYGTTGTPTITIKIRWGGVAGTIIAQTGAITCGSGITTGQWSLIALIQTRSNGATGTLFVQGELTLHEDAVATAGTVTNYGCVQPLGSAGVQAPAAVTVDLTADTALSLTADWSAASSSNTWTTHIYAVESLN